MGGIGQPILRQRGRTCGDQFGSWKLERFSLGCTRRRPQPHLSQPAMNSPLYFVSDGRPLARRSFLAATSSLAAAALWSSRAAGAVLQNPKFVDNPFALGVASGDP